MIKEVQIVTGMDENTGVLTLMNQSAALDFFNSVGFKFNMWTSLDPKEDGPALVNALNKADLNLLDFCNENPSEIIYMRDIVAHTVQLTTQDGEIVETLRNVIIDVNGTSYHSVSDGIRTSLSKIMMVYGEPGFWPEAGIPVRAIRVKTRRGFYTANLVLVEDEPAKPAASPKKK